MSGSATVCILAGHAADFAVSLNVEQAGHTLLDDVFPVFMVLTELLGEVPADIQARRLVLVQNSTCTGYRRRYTCCMRACPPACHTDTHMRNTMHVELRVPLLMVAVGPCHSHMANCCDFRRSARVYEMRLCRSRPCNFIRCDCQVVNVENIHSFELPALTIKCSPHPLTLHPPLPPGFPLGPSQWLDRPLAPCLAITTALPAPAVA